MTIDRRTLLAAAGASGLALIAAACSSSSGAQNAPSTSAAPSSPTSDDPNLKPGPAEPAASGPLTATPAGRVFPINGKEPEGITINNAGLAMVAVRGPDQLTIVNIASGQVVKTVDTNGSARHLRLASPAGPTIAPLEQSNEVVLVDFDGTVSSTVSGVGHNPHDATRTADGTIVVCNELGGGVLFLRDGKVVGSAPPGPVQPGGVAAVGNYAAISDVRGLGEFVYDATTFQLVAKAPIGVQLTHTIALAPEGVPDGTGAQRGIVAIADTMGGAIYLVRITPQIEQVARIETGGTPVGICYDPVRKLVLATVTGGNQLAVIDVADPPNARILGVLPTVKQPNSVASDPNTGDAVVAGFADGVLQVISAAELPR